MCCGVEDLMEDGLVSTAGPNWATGLIVLEKNLEISACTGS